MDDSREIARLIDALAPWLRQVVVVGGWAHQLHRLHPAAGEPSHRSLSTRDADVAFSPREQLAGNIGAALKAAGFVEDLSTDHAPPVTQYHLGQDKSGFYAEFLSPLSGDGRLRDGRPDATFSAAGITAQKLRYLELLLVEPWIVELNSAKGIPVVEPRAVRLPNPVMFIAQKLLIATTRTPAKRAQDILYIHDTIELFARHRAELASTWKSSLRASCGERVARKVERSCLTQFSGLSDPIRSAARIPVDRDLKPEWLLDSCALGLGELFGVQFR